MGTENRQILSDAEINKVRKTVMVLLSSEYDRDLLSDQIITTAWEKGIEHVSGGFIRNKCISKWRERTREQVRNENFAYVQSKRDNNFELQETEQKATVEVAVKCLSSFERKLIWLRFYKNLTLEQIAKEVGMPRERIQKTIKVSLYKMRIELT